MVTRSILPVTSRVLSPGFGPEKPMVRAYRPAAGWPVVWHQVAVMAAVIAVSEALALIGLGVFARFFFMAAAIGCGIYYIKRSPWQFVTMTFWFWTLSPFVRRIIDLQAGFDLVNILLGTPNLMALLMLKEIVSSRELLRLRESIVGFFILVPILYGLGVSFVQGDIVPGAAAAADWLAPVLYYFYFIVNWRRIDEADKIFRDFLSLNVGLIALYTVYQYVSPPPWDVNWVLRSGLPGLGTPVPYEIRIFGTLNAPGLFAIWLGSVILLFLHFRTKVTPVLLPICLVLLFMTLSRSVSGAVVIGFVVAALLGRRDIFKFLGIGVVATVLIFSLIAATIPDLTDKLTNRFNTVQDLNSDISAMERAALYRSAPALINANPLGLGIGALGRGAMAGNHPELVNVDSGPLSIYLALGWVFGSIYLAGIGLVVAQAMLAARSTGSQAAIALAATAVAAASVLPFFNATGLAGATLWFSAAYASAIGIAARERPALKGPDPTASRGLARVRPGHATLQHQNTGTMNLGPHF